MKLHNVLVMSREYEDGKPKFLVLEANVTNIKVLDYAWSQEEAYAMLEDYETDFIETDDGRIQIPIVGFLYKRNQRASH